MARPHKVRVVLTLEVDWETWSDLYAPGIGYYTQAEFRDAVRQRIAADVEKSEAFRRGAIESVKKHD